MKFSVSSEDSIEIERLILILNLGITTALEQRVLSIEDAEKLLYSPYSMEKIKQIGANDKIVDLINLGCELENVERLIPDKLHKSIKEIEEESLNMLRGMPKTAGHVKKWIE